MPRSRRTDFILVCAASATVAIVYTLKAYFASQMTDEGRIQAIANENVATFANGRLRAPDENSPLAIANKRFQACCKRTDEDCWPYCRYDIRAIDMLKAFNSGRCFFSKLSDNVRCASGGKDNSACCEAKGVSTYCAQYCKPLTRDVGPEELWSCSFEIRKILDCHLQAAGITGIT